jgi:two-component system, cell cycle response regulator DivK
MPCFRAGFRTHKDFPLVAAQLSQFPTEVCSGNLPSIPVAFYGRQKMIAAVEKPEREKNSFNCRTVLIVEDHEDTRFMIKTALQMRGYSVLEAENGEEAIRIAESERPDLIIMDTSLPRVDGVSATRYLRVCGGLQNVPIILVSGFTDLGSIRDSFEAGCNSFIAKPFDLDKFNETVARLIYPQNEGQPS